MRRVVARVIARTLTGDFFFAQVLDFKSADAAYRWVTTREG